MVKEVWDSFKENIKERITNPFLGTFLLVWIVQNWRIAYAFFNFDKEYKLQTKIDYFKKYWTEHSFVWNLLAVALITVCVLVVTYLFLALSRYLSNYFENVIVPFVYKLSKGKIVTYETYQKELNRVFVSESRVEDERKLKNQAISDRDAFENLYSKLLEERNSLDKTKEDIKLEHEKLLQSKNEFQNEHQKYVLEKNEYLKEKSKLEASLNNVHERLNNDYSRILEKVNQSLDTSEFERTFLKILKSEYFSSNSSIEFLLKNGLVKVKDKTLSDTISYLLTEEGEEFRKFYYRNKL